jgi:hypothetical protein
MVTAVEINTRCARVAAERGKNWLTVSFDEKTKIRAELDHLLPKVAPERGLSRDGLPPRVNDSRAPGPVSTHMGGPVVPPGSPMARQVETSGAAGAARVETQAKYQKRIAELARDRGWDPQRLDGGQAAHLRRVIAKEQENNPAAPLSPVMSPESAWAAAQLMEQAHRNAEGGGEYAMQPGVGAGRFDHPAR